jgi:hypothetical protein
MCRIRDEVIDEIMAQYDDLYKEHLWCDSADDLE